MSIIGLGSIWPRWSGYHFDEPLREQFARKVYTDEEMRYAMRKPPLAGAARRFLRGEGGHAQSVRPPDPVA